jgi:hypothetical protein
MIIIRRKAFQERAKIIKKRYKQGKQSALSKSILFPSRRVIAQRRQTPANAGLLAKSVINGRLFVPQRRGLLAKNSR